MENLYKQYEFRNIKHEEILQDTEIERKEKTDFDLRR